MTRRRNATGLGIFVGILLGISFVLLLLFSSPVLGVGRGSAEAGVARCENPVRCQEIDKVWAEIGNTVRGSAEVWDLLRWISFSSLYAAPAASGQLCFPIEQSSFKGNLDNWGDDRDSGKRCHAGIDLLTQGEGNVVAIDDGRVLSIRKVFAECEAGDTEGIMVYHPALEVDGIQGTTVNYGEMTKGTVTVREGDAIQRGQYLGKATTCRTDQGEPMLHLEVYSGEKQRPGQWPESGSLPAGENSTGTNVCATRYLGHKPPRLLDPSQLINNLGGKWCSPSQLSAPRSSSSTTSSTSSLSHSTPGINSEHERREQNPTPSTVRNWEEALQATGIHGWSWIGKLASNGGNDNFRREERGRDTIIFVPETTDVAQPVEILYYFHGKGGFCGEATINNNCRVKEMVDRVAPQAQQLAQRRNVIIIMPEMPWSHGTDRSARSEGRSGIIWTAADSDFEQFHRDVLSVLRQEFDSQLQVGSLSLTGHSMGGAALSYAALRPAPTNNYLSRVQPDTVIFSDAGYNYGGSPYLNVFHNYIKYNPSQKMIMIIQDPSRESAHNPTIRAIDFVRQVDGRTDWTYTTQAQGSIQEITSYSTPGAETGRAYALSSHPNVLYVPLDKSHYGIGELSLGWEL